MIYLSKGAVCKGSTEERLVIAHCGNEFILTGIKASLWLNGQFNFAISNDLGMLEHLERMGLIEYEVDNNSLSRYRILTRCVCCPAKASGSLFSDTSEKELMIWLTKAGLRLSVAELICLTEKRIKPEDNLLYERNRQALVESIYSTQNISDNILEVEMEYSTSRDTVVDSLMRLLKKKRLVIL